MVKQQRSQAEQKYIVGAICRTSIIVATWFGLTGIALHAVSDRVSLNCERDEDSIPKCKLGVNRLFNQTQIELANGEIKQVSNRSISNDYLPNFVQWEMTITTDQESLKFTNNGVARSNPWEDFTDRANRFTQTPQLRTLHINSDYSFWFKFISQAVSGISILSGLFIIPSLYLTTKYGNDPVAHQQAVDRLCRRFVQTKSRKATIHR